VAQAAGISVGSLYQYYPNKESLLFALHQQQMRQEWEVIERMLGDTRLTPYERVAAMIETFFQGESEEAPSLRGLVEDAQAHFRDSREYRDLRREADARIGVLLVQTLPGERTDREVAFLADVFSTVIENVGKAVALRSLSRDDVSRWSRAVTDMLCGYAGIPMTGGAATDARRHDVAVPLAARG
jgi:AcrR family transcriptional regulator